jgi:thiamine biosynthesis lipoprotein ApbE
VNGILIDAGGDVVARGRNGERPWTVGIRHPRSASQLLATVELKDQVIATSGDYEHFVEIAGHRYHHLLDPRTGFPASKCRSATVIAPNGALAEALSTALFVLGPRGLAFLSSFAETAALVVDCDGLVHGGWGRSGSFDQCNWVQILLATVNRGRIAQLRRQKGALQGTYGLSTTIDSQEAPNADTSTVDRRREALCR